MKKITVLLLFSFFVTLSQAQFVKNDWGRFFGETSANPNGYIQMRDIESDASGNVYAVGGFRNTVDFDPGPGIMNITSGLANYDDIWFAKYNSSGTLLWVKILTTPSVYGSVANQLTIDGDGDIYIAGRCQGALDLDPNAGTLLLPVSSNWFLAKYDSDGNVVWGTGSYTGNGINFSITDLFINSNNELVSLGDLGSGPPRFTLITYNRTTGGQINSYSLNLPSGYTFNSSYNTDFYKATQDINGNYVLCGAFHGGMDADVTAGTTVLTSINVLNRADMFICKYSASMVLQWGFSIGGINGQGIYSSGIVTDANGNVYVSGTLKDTIDFDPGSGTVLLYPDNVVNGRGFIAKYSSSGSLIWAKLMTDTQGLGANGQLFLHDIKLSANGSSIYFIAQNSHSSDYNTSQLVDLIFPVVYKEQGDVLGNIDLNGNLLNANTINRADYNVYPDRSFWIDGNNNIYIASEELYQNSTQFTTLSFGACKNDPVVLPVNMQSRGASISKYSPCNTPPVITTQPQDTIGCEGLPLTINVGVSGATCKKYHWMKLIDHVSFISWDWQSDSAALYFPAFSVSDTGRYICTIEGECGSSSTQQFVIGGPFTAVSVNVAQPQVVTLCSGTSYTFNFSNFNTVTGTAPIIYQWKKGNTVLSNSSSATLTNITSANSGTYYGIASNLCCADTLEIDFTVQTTSSSLNQTACNAYTLNGQTYTTSNTYTQTLTNNAGCDSLLTLNLIILDSSAVTINQTACDAFTLNGQTYTASDTYMQTLTNEAGCDSVITLNLTINTVDSSVVLNSNILTANITGATYQWINCGNANAIIPTETNQSFTALASGSYAVILTMNGCIDTSACFSFTSVEIAKNAFGSQISIYPSPAQDFLFIEGDFQEQIKITLTDVSGKQVLSKIENGLTRKYELNTEGLSNGMYLLKIQGVNQQVIRKVSIIH